MRRRFFVERFEDNRAHLSDETARHLAKVLRAEPGQLYELSDGEHVWLGKIVNVSKEEIEFALTEEVAVHKPRLHTTLLLAVVKFDRFEWAIEKATELGVEKIVPLAAERSERALLLAAAKRVERWKKIAFESAQQSRRLKPPAIEPPIKPVEAFRQAGAGIKLFLSEEPDAPLLRTILSAKEEKSAALAIGPEGGWTTREIEAARSCGFLEASLGANILRTETAVIAALANLNYALGD